MADEAGAPIAGGGDDAQAAGVEMAYPLGAGFVMVPLGTTEPEVSRRQALLAQMDDAHRAGQHTALCGHLSWFRRWWVAEIRREAVARLAMLGYGPETDFGKILFEQEVGPTGGMRKIQKTEIALGRLMEHFPKSADAVIVDDVTQAVELVLMCNSALGLRQPSQLLMEDYTLSDAQLLTAARAFFMEMPHRILGKKRGRDNQRKSVERRVQNLKTKPSSWKVQVWTEYQRQKDMRARVGRHDERGLQQLVVEALNSRRAGRKAITKQSVSRAMSGYDESHLAQLARDNR